MKYMLLVINMIGTIAFAFSGAMTAIQKEMDILGVIILGMITAVGGGIIRDMMAGNRPYIFVKHVYASASILGACACIFFWEKAGEEAAMLIGACIVIILRLMAIRYRWNLPKVAYKEER